MPVSALVWMPCMIQWCRVPLVWRSGLSGDDLKEQLSHKLVKRFHHVHEAMGTHEWFFGSQFTIVDGYLFYNMRLWQRGLKRELPAELVPYYQRLALRPSIAAALAAEGIAA